MQVWPCMFPTSMSKAKPPKPSTYLVPIAFNLSLRFPFFRFRPFHAQAMWKNMKPNQFAINARRNLVPVQNIAMPHVCSQRCVSLCNKWLSSPAFKKKWWSSSDSRVRCFQLKKAFGMLLCPDISLPGSFGRPVWAGEMARSQSHVVIPPRQWPKHIPSHRSRLQRPGWSLHWSPP